MPAFRLAPTSRTNFLAPALLAAALSSAPALEPAARAQDAVRGDVAHALGARPAEQDGRSPDHARPLMAAATPMVFAAPPTPEKSLLEKLLYVPAGEDDYFLWWLGTLYKISFLAVLAAYYPTYSGIRKLGLAVRPVTWGAFGSVNSLGLAYGLASGNVPLIFTMTPATLWCGSIVRADYKEKATWRKLAPIVAQTRERYRGKVGEAVALGSRKLAETATELRALIGQPPLPAPDADDDAPAETRDACLASCLAYVEAELKLKFLQLRRQNEPQLALDATVLQKAAHHAGRFAHTMVAGVFQVADDDRTDRNIEALGKALGSPGSPAWAEIDRHVATALQQWSSRQSSPTGGITEKFRRDSTREETGAGS